jgi:hypothetical protein
MWVVIRVGQTITAVSTPQNTRSAVSKRAIRYDLPEGADPTVAW